MCLKWLKTIIKIIHMEEFLNKFIDLQTKTEDSLTREDYNLMLPTMFVISNYEKPCDVFEELAKMKKIESQYTGVLVCDFDPGDEIPQQNKITELGGLYKVKINSSDPEENFIYAAFKTPIIAHQYLKTIIKP